MATQTVTTIANLLKYVYTDVINELLWQETGIARLFRREGDITVGKNMEVIFPVKLSRNQGIKWLTELDTFPAAGAPSYQTGASTLKYLYGSIEFSAQALKAAQKSVSAFADLLEESVRDIVEAMSIEIERYILRGDGSGALAKITSATGTITAGNPVYVSEPGAAIFEPGMTLEAWDALSGGTQNTTFDATNSDAVATVDYVDEAANAIYFKENVSVRQNDYLFREGSRGKVMMGILGILDHTRVQTLFGIDRNTVKQFRAHVKDASGAGLSVDLVDTMLSEIFLRQGGKVDCIITSYIQRRKWGLLSIPDRRYGPRDALVDGITSTSVLVEEREIPIIVSRFAAPDEMYFLEKDCFLLYDLGFDWVTADDDRNDVLRLLANKHGYSAVLFDWLELTCKTPGRNGYLYNLAT